MAENSNVQDAFVIAVEQQAREWLRGRIMRLVVTLTRRFLSEEIQRIIGGLSDTALLDK